VEFKGIRIWIGKNAQSNDTLTLKYGYKEDLWLHAKDVAGSHVLIKHQAGKPFPKDVVEHAAQLAAYYSKRKNESLCPVAITPRKFVRKRKGDKPGAVVVDREEVVMVEPLREER
jgi:predicted ribosome quality control (RQC) complex YloA/Tae2 family protein